MDCSPAQPRSLRVRIVRNNGSAARIRAACPNQSQVRACARDAERGGTKHKEKSKKRGKSLRCVGPFDKLRLHFLFSFAAINNLSIINFRIYKFELETQRPRVDGMRYLGAAG